MALDLPQSYALHTLLHRDNSTRSTALKMLQADGLAGERTDMAGHTR